LGESGVINRQINMNLGDYVNTFVG
jgi:hypothetical protein